MANPKDGATREKDGKTQRYNAYTGRWVTQTSPIKNARLLIKSRQEKQDKDKKAKSTWTSGKGLGVGDRGKVSKESDSPQNLKKRFTKDTTSKTGPFGGKNPFKSKSPGSDFKNAPDLKLGTKYKDNKPSSTTTKSQAKDTGGTSDSDKKAWMKRTRNSPAAKSGAFTDAERWALQKKKRLKIKNKGK